MNIDKNLVDHWARLFESQATKDEMSFLDEGCGDRLDEVMAGGEPDPSVTENNEKVIIRKWAEGLKDGQCVIAFHVAKNGTGGVSLSENGSARHDPKGPIVLLAEWDGGSGRFDKERNAYVYIPPNYMFVEFEDMYMQRDHYSGGQANGDFIRDAFSHVVVFPGDTYAATMMNQPLISRYAKNLDSNVSVDWEKVKQAAKEMIQKRGLASGSMDEKKKCFAWALTNLVDAEVKAKDRPIVEMSERKFLEIWSKQDILNILNTWDDMAVYQASRRPTRLTAGNPNNKFGVDRTGRAHGFERLDNLEETEEEQLPEEND